MNKKLFLPMVALGSVLLGGCSFLNEPSLTQKPQDTAIVETSGELPAEESMKGGADSTMKSLSSPLYEDYSQARYSALKGKEGFVLFFHADWCPICRRMEKDITAQLSSFPAGTVILKANFDTETKLKKEYDILVQSTVVVFDKNGKIVYQGQDPSLEELKTIIGKSLSS
jgi:thiol-disulfide isomerase/thioredoxin